MNELDLSVSPNRENADKILAIASVLFDAVKSAPLSTRAKFPKVLRNNNFALALRATPTHAFLEVTTKLHAQRSRELERLRSYRQIFTSLESSEPAAFKINRARLIRISGCTIEAPHAFAIGADFSMCAWDTRSTTDINGRSVTQDINVIYVVGYGPSIREDEAWQEFDTIIRLTLADWSGIR